MISLDQVLLLQNKVETAVAKISELNGIVAQLKAENDALRSKCAELTNSLSEKTELISDFEVEQNKIEQGILSALSRLDTVENSVLTGTAGGSASAAPVVEAAKPAVEEPVAPAVEEPVEQKEEAPAAEQPEAETEIPVPQNEPEAPAEAQPEQPADSGISGQFDIF